MKCPFCSKECEIDINEVFICENKHIFQYSRKLDYVWFEDQDLILAARKDINKASINYLEVKCVDVIYDLIFSGDIEKIHKTLKIIEVFE